MKGQLGDSTSAKSRKFFGSEFKSSKTLNKDLPGSNQAFITAGTPIRSRHSYNRSDVPNLNLGGLGSKKQSYNPKMPMPTLD